MNKIFSIFLFFLSVNFLVAQNPDCNCIDDLNSASQLIQNAKSYSIQIKKRGREADFENWKQEVKSEMESDSLSDFFCVGYLQKYISFIKDGHNQIYTIPENIAESTAAYNIKIDSTKYSADGISGVYYAGREKIFLQRETEDTWYGIMLQSYSDDWPEGKIRLRLKRMANGKFDLFEYYGNGVLIYHNDITVADGRIHSTFWNKANKYYFNVNQEENFGYKSINPSFDYIGIKTLQRLQKLMTEANLFYENTLPNVKSENVIIDLRNNSGGAILQSKPLLKYLKSNKEIRHIFVMMNFLTASAAEQVILELKKDKRTIVVGENSKDMFKYGYGNNSFSGETECSRFKISFSTTYEKSMMEQCEGIGLQPDFYLDNKSDWIEQLMKLPY